MQTNSADHDRYPRSVATNVLLFIRIAFACFDQLSPRRFIQGSVFGCGDLPPPNPAILKLLPRMSDCSQKNVIRLDDALFLADENSDGLALEQAAEPLRRFAQVRFAVFPPCERIDNRNQRSWTQRFQDASIRAAVVALNHDPLVGECGRDLQHLQMGDAGIGLDPAAHLEGIDVG